MPTLYEIAKKYKQKGPKGKAGPNAPSIVAGMKPSKDKLNPGYQNLSPEQLLALNVPTIALNGDIVGHQREMRIRHAHKIATAILRGEEVPPLQVSLWEGQADCTDGQHRALAGVIANRAVPAIVKHRCPDHQAKLFANQRKAQPVSPDTIILAANGLFAEYVQEAVLDDEHPWSRIVGFQRSPTKIGPAQMFALVQTYVGGTVLLHSREFLSDDKFDRGAADLLAQLILVFGTRKENPLAWKPMPLRAVTVAAMKIIRRRGEKPSDVERWMRHMPSFSFAKVIGTATTNREMTAELVKHWNKRLGDDNLIA